MGYFYRDKMDVDSLREMAQAAAVYCRTRLESASAYCRSNANALYARRSFVRVTDENLQIDLHSGNVMDDSQQVWRMVRIVDKQRPYSSIANGTAFDVELHWCNGGTPRRAALTVGDS